MSLPLVGYADPWSAAPGERCASWSAASGRRSARASCGWAPARPGRRAGLRRARRARGEGDGEHPGRVQALRPGSYVEVEAAAGARPATPRFTACSLAVADLPGHGEQAVLGLGDDGEHGFALLIGADGDLELRLGRATAGCSRRTGRAAAGSARGRFAACAVDPGAGTRALVQEPPRALAGRAGDARPSSALLGAARRARPRAAAAGRLRRAGRARTQRQARGAACCSPAPPRPTDAALAAGEPPASSASPCSRPGTCRSSRPRAASSTPGRTAPRPLRQPPDARRHRPPLRRARRPTSARAPDEYAAIMFHDDDLDDAGWEPDFELDRARRPARAASTRSASTPDEGERPQSRSSCARRAAQPRSPVALLLPDAQLPGLRQRARLLAAPDPGHARRSRRCSSASASATATWPTTGCSRSTSATPTAAASPTPRACGRSSTCGPSYDMPLLRAARTSSAPTCELVALARRLGASPST